MKAEMFNINQIGCLREAFSDIKIQDILMSCQPTHVRTCQTLSRDHATGSQNMRAYWDCPRQERPSKRLGSNIEDIYTLIQREVVYLEVEESIFVKFPLKSFQKDTRQMTSFGGSALT